MNQQVDKPGTEPVLTSFDLEGIADYIRCGEPFLQDASSAVFLSVVFQHLTGWSWLQARLAASSACAGPASVSVQVGGPCSMLHCGSLV